ncbi:type II toxin-antitoxin system HicA family toxin [Clostridium mediterraneense]|uniref:type II toxin-antitoxin system HicA family toxin n=1 Tax=Clostridium mediterraneense TaxID=1805472 RepID=UPI0008337DD7|nr:type II toxin-antitoxin system HicA family toxin [Clostridium mediterraneense]
MVAKNKVRKRIPKDYKNINKHLADPQVRMQVNEAIRLSKECKNTSSSLISEKFIDFMTPIQDLIKDLFNDLALELDRRCNEVLISKSLKEFSERITLISKEAINELFKELEETILENGKIILENSNTLDQISDVYIEYLRKLEIIAYDLASYKSMSVIKHLELIQIDTKNYLATLIESIGIESFDLYKDEMDKYKLNLESLISNNYSKIIHFINYESKLTLGENLNTMDDIISLVNRCINEEKDKDKIKPTDKQVFTQYKYTELNKIAKDNGYHLNRVTGGHGIFINKDGKVVIIPQGRDIGKGLQIKILKNIGIR